jgi:hypothetical protein
VREVTKNDYNFKLDSSRRPREISGDLQHGPAAPRARRVQTQAGGTDRRATDEGGHYIALASTARAMSSITSRRTAISIAAHIGRWSVDGARSWRLAAGCTCGLFLSIMAVPSGLTRSPYSGRSTVEKSFELSKTSMAEAAVTDDKYTRMGDLYSDLGHTVSAVIGPGKHHVLVYVEAGPGWADIGIFCRDGNQIRYVRPNSDISGIVLALWRAEDADKRWAAMEYELIGTKFHVRLAYKEEFAHGETDDDRSDAAVRRVLGDGPISYPPWPD